MPLITFINWRVLAAFSADRRGVTALEYALIACVSVMVTVTAVVSVGGGLGYSFDQMMNGFSPAGSPKTAVMIPAAPISGATATAPTVVQPTGPTITLKIK